MNLGRTLILFANDLRLHDHPALTTAIEDASCLGCVFLDYTELKKPIHYGISGASDNRRRFIDESVNDLAARLKELGHPLWAVKSDPETLLNTIIRQARIDKVVRSEHAGLYENQLWQELIEKNPQTRFVTVTTHTLLDETDLPFPLNEFPPTFTQFRKQVESLPIKTPQTPIDALPAAIERSLLLKIKEIKECPTNARPDARKHSLTGGETAALQHLDDYFSGDLPANYKQVRNALDGFDNSTKFSAWLANGNLSPRVIFHRLKHYESNIIENESTYWIYFELLWREFFQWYAHRHQTRLFSFSGIKKAAPLNSFYPERFRKWAAGNTPYPLVNAIMHELDETGYVSNRARQISASCFVNELALDWRYGAAWFEHCLIDYDVASNWGNWQYLAGVGADVQGKRHFNLAKQQAQFDPNGDYINKWQGDHNGSPLDSVDAADWPIA